MTVPEDQLPDLRTRRRNETLDELSQAAMDLFERQGVGATTVQQIADRVGVSVRTAFRLCGSKESVVFGDDSRVHAAMLASVTGATSAREVVQRLQQFWVAELGSLDDDPAEHAHFFRLRRLIATEPELLAAAVHRDIAHAESLVRTLTEENGLSMIVARTIAEFAWTTTRLALDEWARRIDVGSPSPLDEVYLEIADIVASLGR